MEFSGILKTTPEAPEELSLTSGCLSNRGFCPVSSEERLRCLTINRDKAVNNIKESAFDQATQKH